MKIEIFDPPMCCASGVCGPDVDDELLEVNEMILELKERGFEVKRYLVNQQPGKFKENEKVFELLEEEGVDVLPITVVDGEIIHKSEYPTIEDFEQFENING